MKIIVSNLSIDPIYEQIFKQIKRNIIKRNIKDGEKLPSIREFAKEIKVSVITIKKAYEKLEEENLIYTLKGKGSYVNYSENSKVINRELDHIRDDIKKLVDRGKLIGLELEELVEILRKEYRGDKDE